MNALLIVAMIIAAIGLGKAVRHRLRRPGTTRSRVVLAVAAILGAQLLIGAPLASAADCGEAPNPERPGTGMVGALDAADDRGEPGTPYSDYGYAGMVWHTYTPESECNGLSGVTDANTTLDTWAGNQLFNIGKAITGATNALHYTVLEGGLFAPLHSAIETGTEKVYNNIYAQLFGLVALLLAILMFRHIWRGDLPAVSKRALFALAAVWLAASSFALLRYFDTIDRAIVDTTTNIQAGFVDVAESRNVEDILPTNLHDEIIYKNWLRGEFGSADATEAEEHGRDLLDAQAFTWEEMANGDDGDEKVIQEKKAEYKRIAAELGPSSGYFTGEDGSRTGAGFIATLQSLVYSLFQLLAKTAVLLAQVLVRLLALTAPLIGLVALLHHDVLRRVAKVAGTVGFNLIVLSVLAGVHALLLNAIFAASGALSMLTQMAMAALVTILMFVVGRPVRRLWQMVDMSTRTVGAALPSAPGLFSRFRRKPREDTQQDQFWRNVANSDSGADAEPGQLGTATMSDRRVRPEARTIAASAQRLDRQSPQVIGAAGGQRRALPASGTPNPAHLGFNPAGGIGGTSAPDRAYQRRDERRSATTTHRSYAMPPTSRGGGAGYGDGAESPYVVPSRMSGPTPDQSSARSTVDPSPYWRSESQGPRRAETEVINGKPVFVLYRPSRGLEVRQDTAIRDTDSMVR
ncbi:magnesium transporter [Haloechinothrix salitolerans]|uniref:Magnesium transporter n=1 Tax=Haloechinothrix salitolerans TaxID=926830 RepID=A0ABW2C873_9PSEU